KHNTAFEIQRLIEVDGQKFAALHGAKAGPDRDRVVSDFRSRNAKVLITTNVLACGIHVNSLSIVVNYDILSLPKLCAGPSDLPSSCWASREIWMHACIN
ncbi:hypothetical protein B9Z19DRAFT_1163562, partial [Tuber borchii]